MVAERARSTVMTEAQMQEVAQRSLALEGLLGAETDARQAAEQRAAAFEQQQAQQV